MLPYCRPEVDAVGGAGRLVVTDTMANTADIMANTAGTVLPTVPVETVEFPDQRFPWVFRHPVSTRTVLP